MSKTATLDFSHIRPMFGGTLTQPQVDGINVVLATFARIGDGSLDNLAYLLGTTKHETANTMQPIREYGLGKTHPYGKVDATGKAPYGRGYVQLTWRENYERADRELGLGGRLAADYDLALDPAIAAQVLVRGCLEGWFTGKKLGDFADFKNKRRVVNGLDKADLIANYAVVFRKALS